MKRLAEAQVEIHLPWTAEDVSPRVAKGEIVVRPDRVESRYRERRLVEPMVERRMKRCAVADTIGEQRESTEATRRPAAIGTRTHNGREWRTGTCLDDSRNAPAANHLIQDATGGIHPALPKGKVVADRPSEIVRGIELRQSIVCTGIIRVLPKIKTLIVSGTRSRIEQL